MLNLDNEYIIKHDLIHKTIITKHSSDPHNILTPLELCDEIISKIHDEKSFKSDTKVLILCNIEFIKLLQLLYNSLNINMDNVYFLTICKTKAKLIKRLGVNVIKYESYKEFFEDNDLPKFDVVIGNPPYNANIHLKFLEKAYDICDGIIKLVHPGMWLYAQRPGPATAMNSMGNNIKQKIGNRFESFEFINGNRIFNIGLFGPCVITTIDKSKSDNNFQVIDRELKSNEIYTHLNFNPLFDNTGIFDSIKTKIWKYCEINNLLNNSEFEVPIEDFKESKYYINIPCISGNVSTDDGTYVADDFFQFVNSKNNFISKGFNTRLNGKVISGVIKFDNKDAAQNCLSYLINIKLAKFALKIIKINQTLGDGPLKYVPYFDFSEEWNDDKIYKELNLTKEEIQYIEDHV